MKKYFLGVAAIVCALAFSAFTSPNAFVTFKLETGSDPVISGIVSNSTKWTTAGIVYGRCDVSPEDIACQITLSNSAAMQLYYHTTSGTTKIINDFTYANAQPTKQDYVEISETGGLSPDFKVLSLTFKHWNGSSYVTVAKTKGTDYDFVNARD